MSEDNDTKSDVETTRLSRRSMLAGSVGAVGGLIAADSALAQHAAHAPAAQTAKLMPASHATMSGSLSNRIYSLNPTHPDMADIAENPENIPPPITRREPTTVRVDLEQFRFQGAQPWNLRLSLRGTACSHAYRCGHVRPHSRRARRGIAARRS